MNTRIPLRGQTVPVRVSHGPCFKSTKGSRRLRRFIATSKPVSPQTSTEVGKRHALDCAEHFGREEHEFGHGVRSHHQACGVPLEQIDDDTSWWRDSLVSPVRRYLCSKDFWLTSTPKPLPQGSQNLLSKSLQWRSLAFPRLTRAWNTRTLTSRELGTKETENGGACTETSRSTQSRLRVERKFPG